MRRIPRQEIERRLKRLNDIDTRDLDPREANSVHCRRRYYRKALALACTSCDSEKAVPGNRHCDNCLVTKRVRYRADDRPLVRLVFGGPFLVAGETATVVDVDARQLADGYVALRHGDSLFQAPAWHLEPLDAEAREKLTTVGG